MNLALQETLLLSRRRLDVTTTTPDEASVSQEGEFDPKVFWSVNALIFCIVVGSFVWYCCFGGHELLFSNPRDSDEAYRQNVLERRRRRLEALRDSPEKRRKRLHQSFKRSQVSMMVTENDLIGKDETSEEVPNITNIDAVVDADLEAATNGYLMLRVGDRKIHTVPNCCAICLGGYEVGEKVVWSSNEECPHAFHEVCMMDWLTKMLDGTPCPCCRADFTDLEKFRRERRIVWKAGHTFNTGAITLR